MVQMRQQNNLELYTPEGWLNIEAIATLPAWLFVIVGSRQVGKTYGSLKYLLDHDRYTLYLRRTREELEAIERTDDLNPFLPLKKEGYDISIQSMSQNTWVWGDLDPESETKKIKNARGLALPLNYIAKMRGFNGSKFTDMILDEFIPERCVRRLKGEDDTILNLYTTVNGNRELEGQSPLRFWLLANAFNIEDPILSAYGLTEEFEKMERSGREWKLLPGGVFIALPHSERIVGRRAETAQNAYLRKRGAGSNFLKMSLGNNFVYNKSDLIRPKSIAGYRPLCRLGDVFIYENGSSAYGCRSPHRARISFPDTPEGRIQAGLNYPELRMMYNGGYMTFDSVGSLSDFKRFFKIKD